MQVFSSASGSVGSAIPWFFGAVTNPVQIKGSQGQIYFIDLLNSAAATSFLQIFFLPAAKVTLGITVPDWVLQMATNAVLPARSFSPDVPFGLTAIRGGVAVQGSGLTIASTTTALGATVAAQGVSVLYM